MRLCPSLFALFLTILFNGPAIGQDGENLRVSCGGVFSLCGYVDRSSGKEIIPKLYGRAFNFSDGLAAVRLNGSFGYIDTSGEMVIAPQFDLAGEFHFGRAEVLVGKYTGVIDRTGAFVLKPQFSRSIPVAPEVAIVKQGEWKSHHYEGFDKLEYEPRSVYHGFRGIFHVQKGWVIGPDFEVQFILFDPEGRGLIWATRSGKNNGLYGLMHVADGTWKTEPTYKWVYRLSENRVAAYRKERGGIDILDENGKVLFHPEHRNIHSWKNGYAWVVGNNEYGLMDRWGNLLGGRMFDEVREPTKDRPPQVKEDGIWLEVAEDGSLVDVPEEHIVVYPKRTTANTIPKPRSPLDCGEGATLFQAASGLYGMKGQIGNVMIEPKYAALDCYRNGVAWAAFPSMGKWCPIGPDGTRQGKPDCQITHFFAEWSHHYPEPLDEDRFTSSMMWMQKFLAYTQDNLLDPPLYIGDGVQGHGSIPATGRH